MRRLTHPEESYLKDITSCIRYNLESIRRGSAGGFNSISFLMTLITSDPRSRHFSKISFSTKYNTVDSMLNGSCSFEVWLKRKWYKFLYPIKKFVITFTFKDDKVWEQVTRV